MNFFLARIDLAILSSIVLSKIIKLQLMSFISLCNVKSNVEPLRYVANELKIQLS